MEFCELTEEEFRKFSEKHEYESFFQTVETAKLRESYGATIYYLGVKKDKKIVAAGMFTLTPCMFKKNRFYSPQGLLVDYHDYELLKFFVDNLKVYAKKLNSMFIKIDPNVIYRVRDVNGDLYPDDKPDDLSINNLKKVGFKHFGFTKDYRFTQSRWNYRLTLDVPYEELKKKFSKSTRKNIDNMYAKGVGIRRGNSDDLEILTELLKNTAERKHFSYRSLDYHTRMYKYFGDLMHIYIAHVDFNKYLENTKEQLVKEEENKKIIEEKMKVDMVGDKLRNQLETANRLIEKLTKQVEEAKDYIAKYPDGKDIGGLLAIKSGKEYVTLTSGILPEFKSFMPKYIMYNEHILDAYKFGFKYVNFYGISGRFDKNAPIYGVYEFKKGFNGEVIELIGEFTLKLSVLYPIYNMFRHLKITYRKIIKR